MYCNIPCWSYHTPTLTVTLSRADPITPLPSRLHYPGLILSHPYPHGYTISGWAYHTPTLTVTLSRADPITPLPSWLHYPGLILSHPYPHGYTISGWSYHTSTLTVTLSHMKPCTVTSWGNSVTPLPSRLHYTWLILSHLYPHCYTIPHETMYCNIPGWSHSYPHCYTIPGWSYHTPTLTVTLSLADPITLLPSLLHYPGLILSHPYTHCYTIPGWSYHTPTLTVTLSLADPITPLHWLLHYPTWNHVL